MLKTIHIGDKEYPRSLINISNPPKRLYAIGNTRLLNSTGIAIVGSRKASDYGIENCKYFAEKLARCNITIISGMALGIDSIAHMQAIKFNAPTIAVLGTGFNHIYPAENLKLMNDIILNNGLVISECDPDVEFNSKNFAKRNRIISGLSIGVLVIEAAYRSGTSITVNFAKKQGKKVFAIPGRLDLINGKGTNKFIKEGAQITTCVEDLLDSFSEFKNIVLPKDNKVIPDDKMKNNDILSILENGKTVEELILITKKSREEILNTLVELECRGIIKNEVGRGYKKN